MSKKKSVLNPLNDSKEIEDPFFTFTSNVIRFNHGNIVYPLKNITRIGMYEVQANLMSIWLLIFLIVLSLSSLLSGESALFGFGIITGSIAGFGIYRRLKPIKYAFGIKTSSGEERYIISTNKKFISKVVKVIGDFLEKSEDGIKYEINMKDVSIEKVVTDKYEDRSVTNEGVIMGGVKTEA